MFVLFSGIAACKNDAPTNAPYIRPDMKSVADTIIVPQNPERITELSADEFEQYILNNPNVPLIDLRPAKEFTKSHIQRAINIEFTPEGFDAKVRHLQGAGEVLLYDASGIRSARAAQALLKINVSRIKILNKGLYSWAVAHKMQVMDRSAPKK
jgi:rhodanese-related sulfurtransferase